MNPNIEVLCRARYAVNGKSMRTHDQELDTGVDEGLQHVDEIGAPGRSHDLPRMIREGMFARVYMGRDRPVSDHAFSARGHIMASRCWAVVVPLMSSLGSSPRL